MYLFQSLISFCPILDRGGLIKKTIMQNSAALPECFFLTNEVRYPRLYACNNLSTQFRKIILRYKKIGCNINVIRQTACMVDNPIMVNNLASLFNCTPAG